MNRDRIDDLLERALEDGTVPGGASPAERAEVEHLLAAASSLKATARVIEAEAHATAPSARARFERAIAGQSAPAPKPAIPRKGWLALLTHRGMLLAASAAAIGVLAVGAVFLFQAAFSTTHSANAEVLSANDYAQVQGVITGVTRLAGNDTLEVQSAFGPVSVRVTSATAIDRDGAPLALAAVTTGDLVNVSGIAGAGQTVQADSVVVAEGGAQQPARAAVSTLKRLSSPVNGRIIAFAVSPDGTNARILVRAGSKYYIVPLEGAAVERLLARSANAIGADVMVDNGTNPTDSVFGLAIGEQPPMTTTSSTMGVRGIVVARHGDVLELTGLQDQHYTVVLTPSTRIVPGKSKLSRPQIRSGDDIVGHVVSVAGAVTTSNGRINAELIVVGVKLGSSRDGTQAAPVPTLTTNSSVA